MDNRYEWIARVFPEIADTLVDDFDLVEFLSMLVRRTAELLDATEVGVVLADAHGMLRVMASSTERMHGIELFELQSEEGPCHDTLESGEQLMNVDLDRSDERWPHFSPKARALGYRTVHALPMRRHDDRIGAMNIFDMQHRNLDAVDVSLTRGLVDVATIGVLQQRAHSHGAALAEELGHALQSRIAIEQAKGVIAERLGIDTDEGFALLRGYARRNNRLLTDVARDVTSHRMRAGDLQISSSPAGSHEPLADQDV